MKSMWLAMLSNCNLAKCLSMNFIELFERLCVTKYARLAFVYQSESKRKTLESHQQQISFVAAAEYWCTLQALKTKRYLSFGHKDASCLTKRWKYFLNDNSRIVIACQKNITKDDIISSMRRSQIAQKTKEIFLLHFDVEIEKKSQKTLASWQFLCLLFILTFSGL